MSGVTPTPATDSSAITQADIFGALAAERLLPEKCPQHDIATNTLMFRRGKPQVVVFGCECRWEIATMSWRHED